MLSAVLVLVGALAAWLLVDHMLSRREERLRRGRAAWSDLGANRVFHSTGWEKTIPPLEVIEAPLAAIRRRAETSAKSRAAA